MIKAVFFVCSLSLTACATSPLPQGFVYQTSLRAEQGIMGRADRNAAAETLLSAGVVIDPRAALQATLPEADIDVRRWGVRYFKSDWDRYRSVLDADVMRDGVGVTCRLETPTTVETAPTLDALTAQGGQLLQANLETLIAECVALSRD